MEADFVLNPVVVIKNQSEVKMDRACGPKLSRLCCEKVSGSSFSVAEEATGDNEGLDHAETKDNRTPTWTPKT